MKRWRESDSVAVLAILAGVFLSVWIVGPLGFPFRHRPAMKDAAPSPALIQAVHAGVPFHASSLETGFSVRGDYAGMMTWDGSVVHVTLPHALLTRMRERPDGERLKAIRLGLAMGSPSGSWSVVREGPAQPIENLAEGEERLLQELDLTVPVSADASCAWLVLIHELEYVDGSGSLQPAWTYTHSDQGSLAELTGLKVACSG